MREQSRQGIAQALGLLGLRGKGLTLFADEVDLRDRRLTELIPKIEKDSEIDGGNPVVGVTADQHWRLDRQKSEIHRRSIALKFIEIAQREGLAEVELEHPRPPAVQIDIAWHQLHTDVATRGTEDHPTA